MADHGQEIPSGWVQTAATARTAKPENSCQRVSSQTSIVRHTRPHSQRAEPVTVCAAQPRQPAAVWTALSTLCQNLATQPECRVQRCAGGDVVVPCCLVTTDACLNTGSWVDRFSPLDFRIEPGRNMPQSLGLATTSGEFPTWRNRGCETGNLPNTESRALTAMTCLTVVASHIPL